MGQKKSKCVKKLKFSKMKNTEEILFFANLKINGEIVSENFASFVKPKLIELANPEIKTEIKKTDKNIFELKISSAKPALCVWVELKETDAVLSDNFFNLSPATEKVITINSAKNLTLKEINSKLIVKSIWNTYSSF